MQNIYFVTCAVRIIEALLGGGGGEGGTVIPYPCQTGGIYPLSLKVPRLLSLKLLPFEFFIPYPYKYFASYIPYPGGVPQIICSVIPKTPNRVHHSAVYILHFKMYRFFARTSTIKVVVVINNSLLQFTYA